MANGSAADVLQKISERHLECSICCNLFTEPKFLDCLHTFCLKCLHNISQSEGPQILTLECPLCRHETTLANKRLEDLPTNITLSALVEEFAIQEQLLQGQGSEIKCQSCDEQNPAALFCMDCAYFLCQVCQEAHGRLKITKSHKTYTVAQLQSGEIAYKSKLREEPKCDKHPQMTLNIYCSTCEQLMCTLCPFWKHRQHSHADISEAFEKCKEEIAELMEKFEMKKKKFNNTKKDTAESRKKLDTLFVATNKKISQKADKEVARIREMEQKLKQEAKEIYQDRVKTLETADDANNTQLTVAEQTLDEMNQLLAQEIKSEILHLKQKFLHSIRELTKQQPYVVPHMLCFIDFQQYEETEKSLGRLILGEKSTIRFEKERKLHMNYAVESVAAFSNKEIVTVKKDLKHLVTYIPESNPKSRNWINNPDIKDPRQVAVNRIDQLVILDGPAVKTLDRVSMGRYQLLHQFQPGTNSDSKPTCLAVDDDNLIAVGYKAKGEISLHNPDGTLIRRLPAPMIEDHLAISRKQLMYTNYDMCTLVSKSYSGDTEYVKDVGSPRSVCCDSQGNIYVASHLPYLAGRATIKAFSHDGKFLGCAIQECMYPYSMTITPKGDLVLGGWDLLEIYHHV
ncbi:E3 ubiquitin-protein ligase TRIM33-like [Acanthaster planci]|uniref:E3 ubiquitin-protein ligase TRIM33-like n=1 Tax=Acanthaster planci TaxID=133434 RepID=A0A8B7XZQ9_ACAPL|nr:E3 ubiquitin-protein ligase TRIM33-like [Acanthaster planci]